MEAGYPPRGAVKVNFGLTLHRGGCCETTQSLHEAIGFAAFSDLLRQTLG